MIINEKPSSSNCHTFYQIYRKTDGRYEQKFFIKEREAILYTERWHASNFGYLKIEMPEMVGNGAITTIIK